MATRIDRLAQPKPSLLKFPDRRSVYWLDELPAKSIGSKAMFDLTPHWSRLTESKKCSPHFEDNSRPPEWTVSAAALKAGASARVCALALPRMPAADWQPDRPLLPALSMAVRTAKANARICQLARPKKLSSEMTQSYSSSGISLSVPSLSKPSSRTLLLATPKQEHPQYRADRPVSWPVARSVLEAVASERLQVLATPRPRRPLFEGFDPYRVSSAARAATASPRLQELALPPERRRK